MKFIANDGTVFDNQKDCEMYENHNMTFHDVVNIFRTFVHIYDRAKESVDITESAGLSDKDWFIDFISLIDSDDCYYFRIDCDETAWEAVYDILEEESGVEIPKHPGLYWWDDEWISYKDDKRNFESRWKGIAY